MVEVETKAEVTNNNPWRNSLLLVNCVMLSIGSCGSPLVMRLYFIKGGKRIWLSSWLSTGGWPIILIPLLIAYFNRKKAARSSRCTTATTDKSFMILMNLRVFVASAVIGILTGFDNYLYSYGVARLPVSTSTLIIASQLAFTAFFAFLLVKHKFTAYSINAVVLLTVGSAVLALHSSGDRPKGESSRLYILGFIMTVAAAVLYGLILPLVELMYQKAKQVITYTLVLEIQLVMCVFATACCTVAMLINKDFQAIPREARVYELGEVRYYLVLVWNALIQQFFFLGAIGVIFCSSSLLSGVIIAVFLPVTEILAVIFYHEKFSAEKGVALVLSLWGFVSYFYGEIKHDKKKNRYDSHSRQSQEKNQADQETEMCTPTV